MKTIILLALLCPLVANAQNWQISAYGGASAITQPDSRMYSETKTAVSPVGGLGVRYQVSKRILVGVDALTTVFKRQYQFEALDIHARPIYTKEVSTYAGAPVTIINPKASLAFGQFYAGVQAGIVIGGSKDYYESGTEIKQYSEAFTGFNAGVHAGYNYSITKSFGLLAEVRANYIKATVWRAETQFAQIQGALGVFYRL